MFKKEDMLVGGTLQCDGWSDRQNKPVVAALLTICTSKFHWLKILVTCQRLYERADAENLTAFLKQKLEYARIDEKVSKKLK